MKSSLRSFSCKLVFGREGSSVQRRLRVEPLRIANENAHKVSNIFYTCKRRHVSELPDDRGRCPANDTPGTKSLVDVHISKPRLKPTDPYAFEVAPRQSARLFQGTIQGRGMQFYHELDFCWAKITAIFDNDCLCRILQLRRLDNVPTEAPPSPALYTETACPKKAPLVWSSFEALRMTAAQKFQIPCTITYVQWRCRTFLWAVRWAKGWMKCYCDVEQNHRSWEIIWRAQLIPLVVNGATIKREVLP